RIFDLPAIVVSRTDLVNEINDEASWEKHVGHSLRALRPVAGDGLFTAYSHEPNWRKAHNILTPAFSKKAMTAYHSTMVSTVRELVDSWNAKQGQWIDIAAAGNRFTTEVIGRAGIGHSFNRLDEVSDDPFTTTVLRELRYAN
ncbi:cytochrome P450, partial [Mycobacteroides chelonae]